MAGEIQGLARLAVASGAITIGLNSSKAFNIAADGKKVGKNQALSTSAADIDIGDMTWSETIALMVENASATSGEDVILLKSATEFAQIPPGGQMLIFPKADGTAIQAKSATGTPSINVVAAKRA